MGDETPQRLKPEWVAAKLNSIEEKVNKILKYLEGSKSQPGKANEAIPKPKVALDYTLDEHTGEIVVRRVDEPMIGIRDLIAGEK